MSSTPMKFLRSHLPPFIDASPCATMRARLMMSAHVCSAAEIVLPPGVFITYAPQRGGGGRRSGMAGVRIEEA